MLLILLLQRWGFRYVEALVISLIGIIVGLFGVQMLLSKPDFWPALHHLLIPSVAIVTNPSMMFIAIGMLGATVMPHNLYLHSSIVQSRRYKRTPHGKREAILMAQCGLGAGLDPGSFCQRGHSHRRGGGVPSKRPF